MWGNRTCCNNKNMHLINVIVIIFITIIIASIMVTAIIITITVITTNIIVITVVITNIITVNITNIIVTNAIITNIIIIITVNITNIIIITVIITNIIVIARLWVLRCAIAHLKSLARVRFIAPLTKYVNVGKKDCIKVPLKLPLFLSIGTEFMTLPWGHEKMKWIFNELSFTNHKARLKRVRGCGSFSFLFTSLIWCPVTSNMTSFLSYANFRSMRNQCKISGLLMHDNMKFATH